MRYGDGEEERKKKRRKRERGCVVKSRHGSAHVRGILNREREKRRR